MMRLSNITPNFSRAISKGWATLLLVSVTLPAFARHKNSSMSQPRLTPQMIHLIDLASMH